MTVRFSACLSFVEIIFFPSLFFHLIRVGVLFVRFVGHLQLTLNTLPVTLTDMDHLYRKENNETTQTGSTSALFSPITTKPRNPLARESLMASTFCDGNQDIPLLHWADDGPLPLVQPHVMTNYSARPTPELSPATPSSNISSRPPEKYSGRQGARRQSTCKDSLLSPFDPTNGLHKGRFGFGSVRKDADATNDFRADGVYHCEDSAEVDLEGNLEMEIDSLLDDLMDYRLKRTTMTSAPLLPLPEEFSPASGSASLQMYSYSPLPPSATDSMLFSGDSDSHSFTLPSPRSSVSHFSPTRSPSSRSFTPITPSTDGWRSPPTLATVLEHESSGPDSFGFTRRSGNSAAWSHNPQSIPEDDTLDSYIRASSETRRAHHTNLPPIRTTIPEDSTVRRRAKTSISSERTVTDDHRSRVGSLANRSFSSYSSGNEASRVTEAGYLDSGFDHECLSNASAVSIRFAQPDVETPRKPWLGAFGGTYSPNSSIGPGFADYPSLTKPHHAPSLKRGMLQSIFSQNSSPEQKKERKWSKMRDPVKTQTSPSQSVGNMSFATKSSEDRGKKKREKAEKRAQLAAELKAKQLQEAAQKDRGTPLRAKVSGKALGAWEERGGMYSIDGFI